MPIAPVARPALAAPSEDRRQPCWHGHLQLGFARQGERTALLDRQVRMPLALQRPFYPEGARVCHALLLHPPGGLVGGDLLEMHLDLQPGCEVLVSTPAAGKWYRGASAAQQLTAVRLAADAHLEWLPQESIVFNGAQARQQMRVELAASASWLGWDITRFGRSASGERFEHGAWRAHTEVWRAGQPLWIDRQHLQGGSRLLQSSYGLGGHAVVGTLAWLGQAVTTELVSAARALWLERAATGDAGVTRLPQGLVCRYRGPSSADARSWFTAVWDLLRRAYRGRAAQVPRIWST